jgi:hypothetical protein
VRPGNLPVRATAVKDVVEECGGGWAGCRVISDQLGLRQRAAAGPVNASALTRSWSSRRTAPRRGNPYTPNFDELLAEPGNALP